MDNQLNQNLPPQNQDQKIPEPPPLEINVRTMDSDVRAFQETGGETPDKGIKSNYSVQKNEEVIPQQVADVQIPGYQGPEKPIFSSAGEIIPKVSQQTAPKESGVLKMILIIAAILAGVVGLGLLGYYVVFPLMFK